MPGFLDTPLTEDEKAMLPMMTAFVGQCNAKIFTEKVDMVKSDVRVLQSRCVEDRTAVSELRKTVIQNQGMLNDLRIENAELRKAVIQNQGTVSELRTEGMELRKTVIQTQGTVDELRTANNQLTKANQEIRNKYKSALEAVEKDVEKLSHQVSQDLPQQLDKLVEARVAEAAKPFKERLIDCVTRVAETEYRQENVDGLLDQLLASKIQGTRVLDLTSRPDPSPLQEPEQDQDVRYEQPKRRRMAPGRGHRSTAPGSMDPPQASIPEIEAPQAPAEDERVTRQNQIKQYYQDTKNKYQASPPKNERVFIWQFIEGSGDGEFCTWVQEHLLTKIPVMVRRAKRRPCGVDDRIIALSPRLKWNDVRQAMRNTELPF